MKDESSWRSYCIIGNYRIKSVLIYLVLCLLYCFNFIVVARGDSKRWKSYQNTGNAFFDFLKK